MGLKEWITGVSMILLFTISLLFFMTLFIQQNNPEGLSPQLSYLNDSITDLTSKVDDIREASITAKTNLEEQTPSPVFLFLIIYSAFTVPISFISFLMSGLFAVVDLTFSSLFGSGTNSFYIILTVISGILTIGIVLAILKAIRLGQVDR